MFLGNDLELGPDNPNRTTLNSGFLAELNAQESPRAKAIKSPLDFIEFVPPILKTDVARYIDSRSLQKGERYLMKSPNSEVVMSINNHPDIELDQDLPPGAESVEMQFWNGALPAWEYAEVVFEEGKPPEVRRNPKKCLNCHGFGKDTRPNMDPYNFWSQTSPSLRDQLYIVGLYANGDPIWSRESREYLEFLDKIKADSIAGKKTRYSVLKHMLDINDPDKIRKTAKIQIAKKAAEIRAGETKGEPDQYVYKLKVQLGPETENNSPTDGGVAVNLFDQMYRTNFCRIVNSVTDPENNPSFPFLKYALFAAASGCIDPKNIAEFLPPGLANQIETYFSKRGLGEGKLADVEKDTKQRQDQYFKDRVGRKLWNLENEILDEILNSEEHQKKLGKNPSASHVANMQYRAERAAFTAAEKELDELQKKNRRIKNLERNIEMLAPLRYLLEPFGVDTTMFSLSVDPMSYTFGDQFAEIIRKYEPFKSGNVSPDLSKRNGEFDEACKKLQRLSKEALSNSKIDFGFGLSFDPLAPLLENALAQCHRDGPEFEEFENLKSEVALVEDEIYLQERKELKKKVGDIFTVSCSGCHENGTKGAPYIPFGNIDELDSLLARQAGANWGLAHAIWKRVNRHEDLHGSMPMFKGNLDSEDLSILKKYFESFPVRSYVGPSYIEIDYVQEELKKVKEPKGVEEKKKLGLPGYRSPKGPYP